MKKIIPQPVVPKTEEVGQLEQEQKLSEEQKVVFIERKNDASSSEKKWEKWGFTKKNIDLSNEIKEQKAEKLNAEKQEHAVNNKSDIILSFDEKWVLPVVSKEKTYDFRRYKLHPETKRMWFYVNQPVSQLLYIAEIDPAVEYPNQIPKDGIGNKEFNQGQGINQSKFAYKIKHLYKLNNPIGIKELKSRYGISPPRKYIYVGKYTDLVNDIVIERQTKLF